MLNVEVRELLTAMSLNWPDCIAAGCMYYETKFSEMFVSLRE